MVSMLVHPTDEQREQKINDGLRSIGAAIRAARKQTGMSMMLVAGRARVALSTVERIEAGESVRMAKVLAVAEVVGVAVEVRS